MATEHLSKSDFKIARTCPTKLYYKKLGYPSSKDTDEYLRFLADGGFLVAELAKLYFYDKYHDTGIVDLSAMGDRRKAVAETAEMMKRDNVVIFEAGFASRGKLIRVDILEKLGSLINVIEVKAKAQNPDNPEWGGQDNRIKYLEDVTFQVITVEELYPASEICGYLMLLNKNKPTRIEGLQHWFQLEDVSKDRTKFREVKVHFTGDRKAVVDDGLLYLQPMENEIAELRADVIDAAGEFLASFQDEIKKIPAELTTKCFGCEYDVKDDPDGRSGYRECWSTLADIRPHINELRGIGGVYRRANQWIVCGEVNAFDIPDTEYTGATGTRWRFQIPALREGKEWHSDELARILTDFKYPLHFVDFEATHSPLPFHKGVKPYEWLCFQWSCHTIPLPGAEPVHCGWLNVEDAFPNFEFAHTLMDHVGSRGTFLMWHRFERLRLQDVDNQMSSMGHEDPDLREWLRWLVEPEKAGDGKWTDMDRLTLDHYFHPAMGRFTSIKVTLPAVLHANQSQRTCDWLKNFDPPKGIDLLELGANGKPTNPYKLLPPIDDYYDDDRRVVEGTGAMIAYQDMLYGVRKDDEDYRRELARGLWNYCKLDTLAMVIIWEHWCQLIGIHQ